MNKTGRIHSVESFGAADGPGVRYVVFMQGCPMRCKYCHNPDTWDMHGGTEMTAEEIITKAIRYKAYWKNDGGITVSGGEPLSQIDFVTELLKLAKQNGINTAIDTSGVVFSENAGFLEKFDLLMQYTDLVLLDIKEINEERHKLITGHGNKNILRMAEYLSEINKPVWIRHVLVPEYSDFDEDLQKLSEFIRTLKNVEKVEILPYHTLGKFKWETLNIPYELESINPPTQERIKNAEKILL
ncbi:MAG: pyruvate formate lyase-activating protein [Oscillospiraceae bacterium]|nr:pyruvate formate lyase-activating protein [Oscillospiraceae bacterium]